MHRDLILQAKQLVEHITAQPAWALLVEALAAATILIGYGKPIARLVAWLRKRRATAIATSLRRKTHVASFTDSEIEEAVQRYIEPDTSNVDPADEDDLRDFAFVREPIFAVVGRALASPEKRHLLVLADSGMGKTTLLLNLVARELKKRDGRRNEIALVPLGRADAEEQIKAVTDQRNTILLLDAFDEDTHAIEDHRTRLQEIMVLAADFKAVILTSRTQFFTSESDVPTVTGVARVGPRRAGALGAYYFQRIYLLPFSESQINFYIKKITPWYRFARRRRARALVSRIPELTVRPMLLALLPDLLSREKEFREIWDLYKFMVKSWLTRESHWIDPEKLLRISKKVAVNIYLGRQSRHSERLSLQELAALLDETSSSIETWKLTGRSLLNRDSAGNFKFAHRSIMEFLFVLALVDGDDECGAVPWTDMMCSLFLSWGRSVESNRSNALERARVLLQGDGLSKTGIFPLVETYDPASRIDAQWARRASGQSAMARTRAGIPSMWRKWTSRVIERGSVIRVYEFSEGLVWECVDMRSCAEPHIFRIPRRDAVYHDGGGGEWTRPTLAEFCSLAQVLIAHDAFPLYEQDLYWLRDEDDQSVAMVRLRDIRKDPEALPTLRESAQLVAGNLRFESQKALDVYAVPKVAHKRFAHHEYPANTAALQVKVWRGNAQKRWVDDNNIRDGHLWHLTSDAASQMSMRIP